MSSKLPRRASVAGAKPEKPNRPNLLAPLVTPKAAGAATKGKITDLAVAGGEGGSPAPSATPPSTASSSGNRPSIRPGSAELRRGTSERRASATTGGRPGSAELRPLGGGRPGSAERRPSASASANATGGAAIRRSSLTRPGSAELRPAAKGSEVRSGSASGSRNSLLSPAKPAKRKAHPNPHAGMDENTWRTEEPADTAVEAMDKIPEDKSVKTPEPAHAAAPSPAPEPEPEPPSASASPAPAPTPTELPSAQRAAALAPVGLRTAALTSVSLGAAIAVPGGGSSPPPRADATGDPAASPSAKAARPSHTPKVEVFMSVMEKEKMAEDAMHSAAHSRLEHHLDEKRKARETMRDAAMPVHFVTKLHHLEHEHQHQDDHHHDKENEVQVAVRVPEQRPANPFAINKDKSLAPLSPSMMLLSGGGGPDKEDDEEENNEDEEGGKSPPLSHEPKKISLRGELLSIVFSLLSVAMTAASYATLGRAATHVEPILRNWAQKPVMNVHLVPPGAACPADSTSDAQTVLQWPGVAALGCACPAGSAGSSSAGECSDDQLAGGCVQDAPVAPIALDSWRGSRICLQRGGQAVFTEEADGKVVTRPNPDPQIPHQCPDGYRRCGRTSMDGWRATCTPKGTSCPVTLLASESVFPYYGPPALLLSMFERYQSSRAWLQYGDKSENLYMAESSLVVSKQLPLVEFMVSFLHPEDTAHPFLGPCNEDTPLVDNLQGSYKGTAAYAGANATRIDFQYPPVCTANGLNLDSRWRPVDVQSEGDLLLDNLRNSPECVGLPVGDLRAALDTNYWKSGAQCTTNPLAPVAMQCSAGITAAMACGAEDTVCRNAVYQSRCGRLVNAFHATKAAPQMKVGLFTRNEIYWKESCSSDYAAVKANNLPLQRAITAITTLLGMNVAMNLITIAVSIIVIVIYEFNIDIPCIDGGMREDAAFLKLLTDKISGAAKVFKVVPCAVAIVYLSHVLDFYKEIAAAECSDPTTNMNFNSIGATLPMSYNFAVVTLVMDVLQLAAPFCKQVYQRLRYGKQKVRPMERPVELLPVNDEEL